MKSTSKTPLKFINQSNYDCFGFFILNQWNGSEDGVPKGLLVRQPFLFLKTGIGSSYKILLRNTPRPLKIKDIEGSSKNQLVILPSVLLKIKAKGVPIIQTNTLTLNTPRLEIIKKRHRKFLLKKITINLILPASIN